VLRSGRSYTKLSAFEFLDPARRQEGVVVEQFHSWPAFSQAASDLADRAAVALLLDPPRQTVHAGTFGQFVEMLLNSRIDAWIVARDGDTCLVSTHERDLAVLRLPND
jgi:hypothetical protein